MITQQTNGAETTPEARASSVLRKHWAFDPRRKIGYDF